MWVLINIILSLITSFIIYNLVLSFCGVFLKLRKSFLPVLIFSIIIFISKYLLHNTSVVHTILLVLLCTLLIKIFNRIDFILCMIGTLLTFIIMIIMSTIIVCPLILKIGFTFNMNSLEWVMLNFVELFTPFIALFIFRKKKRSIIFFTWY